MLFRELFQRFGIIWKLFGAFLTNFEIAQNFLCYFLKNSEFGRTPEFWEQVTALGPRANQKTIGETITQPKNKRQKIDKTKKKWVDDFTVLASIDLKENLVPDPAPVHPVPWRGLKTIL